MGDVVVGGGLGDSVGGEGVSVRLGVAGGPAHPTEIPPRSRNESVTANSRNLAITLSVALNGLLWTMKCPLSSICVRYRASNTFRNGRHPLGPLPGLLGLYL